MCNDMPYQEYGHWGWNPCNNLLGLYIHNKSQARQLELQLQWSRRKALKAAKASRGNGRAVGLAEMEVAPWPVQVQTTDNMA